MCVYGFIIGGKAFFIGSITGDAIIIGGLTSSIDLDDSDGSEDEDGSLSVSRGFINFNYNQIIPVQDLLSCLSHKLTSSVLIPGLS